MKLKASVISHPGKIRPKNEDNFFFNEFILDEQQLDKPYNFKGRTDIPILMGVFDGMGGISAGERASAIAANTARDIAYTLYDPDEIKNTMVRICKAANETVCKEMTTVVKGRMGTTASMLCFFDNECCLCNIGDSPIYMYRGDVLKEISHEHTEKENYIMVYGEDAIPKNKKFRLTQHIGIFPDELEIEPYISIGEVVPGDRFIICSDGLSDMVKEPVIAQVMSQRLSTAETVNILLKLALDNGGRDNTTIICIDVY